ncbi:hypothetical protein [Streptomyces sp. NPDC024089]
MRRPVVVRAVQHPEEAVVPLPTNQPLRYAARASLEKWPTG